MALPKGLLGTIQSKPLAQIPPKPHGGPFSSQNHVFSGGIFRPKRSPAQPEPSRIQIWDPGVPKWVRGLKISNFRIEKPCRIQWSVFQTEPYVASYGRKPFWATWHEKWGEGRGGDPKEMCLQTRHLLCLQTRHLLCQQTRHLLCHCVSRHLPRHPPGILHTGAATKRPPLWGEC